MVPGVRGSWMAMIWSNLVAGSALRVMAAAGVTRSARPRMSATMISLPSPFILAKGAALSIAAYMAETTADYQCRRALRGRDLALAGLCLAARLEQEPGAALGLIDEGFQEARGGDVVLLAAKIVGAAHAGDQCLVVLAQFAQHVLRRHEVGVVVLDALQASDMADRAQRGAAQLAGALGQFVGHFENLLRLLVQQQVIVAEMRSADMPVEILGLQVKGKDVGQECVERAGNVAAGIVAQAGGRGERGFAAAFGSDGVRHDGSS